MTKDFTTTRLHGKDQKQRTVDPETYPYYGHWMDVPNREPTSPRHKNNYQSRYWSKASETWNIRESEKTGAILSSPTCTSKDMIYASARMIALHRF